jgi:pyridoxal biosynthesis lyase PdxS
MVRIRHHIPDAKYRKPDTVAASVIYNATCQKNKRHGIIAAAWEVCNASRRLGNGSHLILCQRVRGSTRAARGVRNTRVFQTETRVVADASLEDELKFRMSDKSKQLTAILLKVMRIVHLKSFQTPKIGITGMRTWVIQIRVRTTGIQKINQI